MMKYDFSENEIVLCREFYLDAEARLAQSVLEDSGIDCVLDGELFGSLYPGAGFASVRLMVRRRDLERALDIVNSMNFKGE